MKGAKISLVCFVHQHGPVKIIKNKLPLTGLNYRQWMVSVFYNWFMNVYKIIQTNATTLY